MAVVLVVEDEVVLGQAYCTVLTKAGFDVDCVENGQEALESFKNQPADLILLDLRMPKMDGVTFLKKLEPAKNYPKTKIIVFSNYDDQKEVEDAMKHGATRYILKAWSSPNELLRVVKETLAEPSLKD